MAQCRGPTPQRAMRERIWSAGAAVAAGVLFALVSVPDLGVSLITTLPSTPLLEADPVVQASVSRLGAPDAPGWLASSVISRVFLAAGPGSPVEALGVMAVLAGALAIFLVMQLYRRCGLKGLPALVGAGLVAGGASTLSLVASGSVDTLVLPFVVGLLVTGVWWVETGARPALTLWLALTVVTVGSYPVALAVVAVVAGLQAFKVGRGQSGWRPFALTVVAAAGGLIHRTVAAGLLAADITLRLGLAQASVVTPAWSASAADVAAAARAPASAALSVIGGELGLLGGLLVSAGVVVLVRGPGPGWLVCAAAGLCAARATLWGSSTPGADQAALMLLVWLPAGVGLHWAVVTSPTRSSRLGIAAVGVLLLASNLVRHEARVPWFADAARTPHMEYLMETLRGAWLAAEHPSLDRALSLPRGPSGGGLLPDDGAAARRAAAQGDPLFAFARGRARLARIGFQFAPAALPPAHVTLRHWLESLPRRSVVAAIAGPDFVRAVASGATSPFSAVGGSGPVSGASGVYAVVGVVGGGEAALEREAPERVVLDVDAGDPLGTYPMRSSAGLHLEHDGQDAWLAVDGRRHVGTQTGLALVALTPDGQILASFATDVAVGAGVGRPESWRVPLPSAGPEMWRLVGTEACVQLPPNQWVDVTAASRTGGLAAVRPAAVSGPIQLYVGAPVPMRPVEQSRGRPQSGPTVETRFVTAAAEHRLRLTMALQRDELSFGSSLLAAPVVERLELEPGVSSVAFRGAPETAFARFLPEAVSGSLVDLCGMVWGEAWLADPAAPSVAVPVADLDRLGWGWHDVEEDGAGTFRWSDGPETETLLQLTRTAPIRVEVDLSSAGVDLTNLPVTVTVLVNGAEMTPLTMTRDVATYGWSVPPAAWKIGMNRLGLRVSAAVSPATLGLSDDSRSLGVALRRLQLTRLE